MKKLSARLSGFFHSWFYWVTSIILILSGFFSITAREFLTVPPRGNSGQNNTLDNNEKFANIKKIVLRHFMFKNGPNKPSVEESSSEQSKHSAGLNIGRIYLFIYKKGKPFSDFEDTILIQSLNGVNVGNTNPSRKIPQKLFKIHLYCDQRGSV